MGSSKYLLGLFFMESKSQKAVVVHEYGKKIEVRDDFPKPFIKDGELLIKVEASTVNPSDIAFLQGRYCKRSLPTIGGLEGTGKVVEAKGQQLQHFIGKRVSFLSCSGSWSQYAVSYPDTTFEIDQDIPLSSASSGVVNPLTAVAFIQIFKQSGSKGIIMTAAASCLGKMVNRLGMKEKIPVLNLVRTAEEAEILKKQGIMHVLVTKGSWDKEFKEYIEKYGFNCVFDALGGGSITETIMNSLTPKARYYMIGTLEKKPLHIDNPSILYTGVKITGFQIMDWWSKASEEIKKRVRAQYSSLLKSELKTSTSKEFPLKSIQEAIDMSQSKCNEGKVLVRIE